MKPFVWVVGLVAVVGGCSKGGGDASANANTNTSASANANTNTSASANASASATAKGSAKGGGKFGGKYVVSVGTMYVPSDKDWASVKFKNEESKHLGEGEVSIAIDGDGRVSGGTEGGPLGASVLDGRADGNVVTATIRRKDPSDEGLTGTLVAKREGDSLEGTMKLAEFNAAVVREAKVSATAK